MILIVQDAAASYLEGILGFEEQPLVSTDFVNDPRSSIVDALSTQVCLLYCIHPRGSGGMNASAQQHTWPNAHSNDRLNNDVHEFFA